jgi:hypothetical protein
VADAEGQGLDKSTQAKMENDATTRKNRLSARETSMTGLGIRPRTPPLSPSSQSYAGTDRLSVLSATATDLSDFSPSPTASIGSVRIATVTRVPCRAGDRRVSTGMASIASEDGYLSDASLTLRGMGASGERAIASSASRLDAEPELREDEFESGTKKHHESRAATRLATSKWQRGLSSSQNRLSSDEWAARPGSSQSSDHTGRQSMSILGEPPRLYTSTVSKSDSRHYLSAAPVTRVLSPPPWVEAHGDENVYPTAAPKRADCQSLTRPPRQVPSSAQPRQRGVEGRSAHIQRHDLERVHVLAQTECERGALVAHLARQYLPGDGTTFDAFAAGIGGLFSATGLRHGYERCASVNVRIVQRRLSRRGCSRPSSVRREAIRSGRF